MKGLSLEMVGIFAGAVDFIAQKGMPKAGHMYTDLVGAACLKTALYIGGVPETFQNLIMGDGILAVFVVDGHFLAVNRVTADWPLYGSLILLQIAGNNSPVSALDGMVLQLLGQIPVCGVIFAHKKCPGGVFVNAVDNAGTHYSVDSGKISLAVVHNGICQGSAGVPVLYL